MKNTTYHRNKHYFLNAEIPPNLFFLFIILQSLFLLGLFLSYDVTRSLTLPIMVGAGIIVIVVTLFSMEKLLLVLLTYTCLFPLVNYLHSFPGLPIWYSNKIGFPLFIIVIFYWIIGFTMKKREIVFTSFDWAILCFMGVFLLSALLGFAKGYRRNFWVWDFIPLSFYLVYFIFVHSPLREKDPRWFFDLMLGISILISIEFLYAILRSRGFFLQRIMTRHIHLVQLSIPYIGATLVYSASLKRKILSIAALPIILLAVGVSMERTLWVTIVLSLGFFLLFLFVKRKLSLFFAVVVLGILLIGSGAYMIGKVTKSKVGLSLLHRAPMLLKPSLLQYDVSLIGRWRQIKSSLNTIKSGTDFLIGKGLGASFFIRNLIAGARTNIKSTVDNTYVFLIWKIGAMGLLAYLVILFVFLKRCIFLFKYTKDSNEKIYSITSGVNMIAMMIIGLSNCSLAHYRLILVWALNFGVIEVLAQKYMRQHD